MTTIHYVPIGKFKYTKDDMGNYHSYNDQPAIEYLDGKNIIKKKQAISYICKKKYATVSHPGYFMTPETMYKYYINGKEIVDK